MARQPAQGSVLSGGAFSVSVVPLGTPPFYYQWRQSGVPIPGATNDTVTFTNATVAESGGYDVIITNLYGAVTSAVATVSVIPTGTSSTVTAVAYYRLGENDPGAVAGHAANSTTVDLIGGANLSVLGTPATYSASTGVTGSTLCLALNGGGVHQQLGL